MVNKALKLALSLMYTASKLDDAMIRAYTHAYCMVHCEASQPASIETAIFAPTALKRARWLYGQL